MIESNQISVVIQGAILIGDNNKSITGLVCDSVRKLLPKSEIIVSTWEGEDVSSLDCDYVIFNKKISANYIYRIGEETPSLHTVNHQLVTTIEGIKKATRKFLLKLRSDLLLEDVGFIKFFESYQCIPQCKEFLSWKLFEKRVVVLPTFNVNKKKGLVYNISDWVFFGQKKDIQEYFDIPLLDTFSLKVRPGERYPRGEDCLGSEQYYCVSFINKYRFLKLSSALDKDKKLIKEFEIFLANNFIPISAQQFRVFCVKYPQMAYSTPIHISQGFYSITEWEKLYNKYGGGNIRIPFRFKERIYYPIHYFLYSIKDVLIKVSVINFVYRRIRNIQKKIACIIFFKHKL